MTLFDVLDDTVKIGLGAALVLIGNFLTNRHQQKMEMLKRRAGVVKAPGASEPTPMPPADAEAA